MSECFCVHVCVCVCVCMFLCVCLCVCMCMCVCRGLHVRKCVHTIYDVIIWRGQRAAMCECMVLLNQNRHSASLQVS